MNTSTGGFARKKQPDEPPQPRRVLRAQLRGHRSRTSPRGATRINSLIAELTKTMTIAHTSLRGPALTGRRARTTAARRRWDGRTRGGERASELAVAVIEQFTVNTFKWFLQDDDPGPDTAASEFAAALNEADAAIISEGEANPALQGMGTTPTLAYAVGPQLFVLHVGDSRAYLFRGGAPGNHTRSHRRRRDGAARRAAGRAGESASVASRPTCSADANAACAPRRRRSISRRG